MVSVRNLSCWMVLLPTVRCVYLRPLLLRFVSHQRIMVLVLRGRHLGIVIIMVYHHGSVMLRVIINRVDSAYVIVLID